MSIQSLPLATVRAIGSCQGISDPTSLVKELVDNSLDAHSTAIFVEISANTLDIVYVRDNGHGVAPDDRPMVCRRYCTSKIRQYSDLKDIGGKWLGFRGEALACAAELCDTMTLTTRVEGEEIAVTLKVKIDGEVDSQEPASHPVGTSVRLTNLFNRVPVRRQTALKASSKCLAAIKRLMQIYALARPSIRLSLKILGAKNSSDWIYAPGANPTIQDAACKVIGKDCASHCSWSVIDSEGYRVQAFIPAPTANVAHIDHAGHFLLIDSRPVSTRRGVLKQIISTYRDYLKASNPGFSNLREPFLWMNIDCPTQSYDPNVEPSKDDVVFEDSEKVLRAVRALLDEFYPLRSTSLSLSEISLENLPSHVPTRKGNTTDLRAPLEADHGECDTQLHSQTSTMYSVVEENLPEASDTTCSPPEIRQEEEETLPGLRDINVSNPWIIAKMHASVRPKPVNLTNRHLPSHLEECSSLTTDSSPETRPAKCSRFPTDTSRLATVSPPRRTFATTNIEQEADALPCTREILLRSNGIQTDRNNSETGAIHGDSSPDSDHTPTHRSTSVMSNEREQLRMLPVNTHPSIPSADMSRNNLLPSMPPITRHVGLREQPNRRNVNKPFVSPLVQRAGNDSNSTRTLRPQKRLKPSAEAQGNQMDVRFALHPLRQSQLNVATGELLSREPIHSVERSSPNRRVAIAHVSPDCSSQQNASQASSLFREPHEACHPPALEQSNGEVLNHIVTLHISLNALASLLAEIESLNPEKSGYADGDLHQPRWCLARGRLNNWQADSESNNPEEADYEIGAELLTSLLHPAVETWEIKRWNRRILKLLGEAAPRTAGQHGMQVDGGTFDVLASMKAHMAGRLSF